MAYLQSLIDDINNNEQFKKLEIEIRLLTNNVQFKAPKFVWFKYSVPDTISFAKSIMKMSGIQTGSQTANFITNINDGKFIKQLTFLNGIQDKSKLSYQVKTHVDSVFLTTKDKHIADAKVGFAIETEAKASDAPVYVDLVRFKRRISIIPEDPAYAGWQIDITLVKEAKGTDSVQVLKTMRDTLFKSESEPWDYADKIEIEIERIAKTPLKISEFKIIDLLVFSKQSKLADIADAAKLRLYSDNSTGFKRMGAQVIELTKSVFTNEVFPNLKNMWLTDKADGIRAFIIFGNGTYIVTSTNLTGIKINDNHSKLAIADAEYLEDEKSAYVFDMLVFDGRSVINKPFEERKELIAKVVGGDIHSKEFVRLDGDFGSKIKAMLKEKRTYETDGLIMTMGGDKYLYTKNYKWKPLEKMTIDFLVRKCPHNLLGVAPYINKPKRTLYFLFSYTDSKKFESLGMSYIKEYNQLFPNPDFKYFPIQFATSIDPFSYLFWDKRELDGKIVELAYDGGWKYYRTRDDKEFPNDFKIAELTYQNYFNPLTLDDITTGKSLGYFQEDDSKLHAASRHFNSFVKGKVLEPYADTPWIIDMAGGKGQDIFRYAKLNIKNLVYLEIDKDGISEIIKRRHALTGSTKVYTIEMDLNAPTKSNIKIIEKYGLHLCGKVPIIVCNLAIHYLIGGIKAIENLIKFIDYYLAPGGKFLFTAFDGKSVFDLISAHNWKWDVRQGEVLKYSIHRAFKSNQMTSTNQKIKVKLPFSGDSYYEEYLVNNDFLEKMFKKYKFRRESFDSFAVYLKEYAKESPKGFAAMSDDDKEYASLYYFVSYFKPN